MKHKFKRLLSALSAVAVTLAAVPITELSAIAEEEIEEIMSEPTDFFELEEAEVESEEVADVATIAIEAFDAPMIMAAETGITRAEWIHDLVTVFDMSIEDDSTMEYYFTDIGSSTYAYDINLAANYGVFDIESDSFNPSDYVTREFAAHTANFCMGYLDDGTTVTFSDSNAIYYEYDAIVAVQRGWFTVQSGKFVPNGNMNDSERQKILEDARVCQESTSINEDNDNTVKYANSVVQFETTSNAAYFDGVVTISNTKTSLKKGDMFLVNVDGADCLYTANAVTKDEDGNLIVDVETAKTESAVEYIDIEGFGEVDYDNIVFYDTASTVADVAKLSIDNGMLYLPRTTAIRASATKDSITLNKKLEDDGIIISLSGAITNIKPEYKLKLNPLLGGVESFYLNASADASLTASMKGEFKNTKSKDIKIASVPVICAGIFNVNMIVSVTVSVSGETTLSYSWDMDGGVSYTNADGWRTTKNFQKKGFSLEAKVSESVAVKAALVATLGKEKMGEAYLMGGEKGTISGKQQKDGVGCVTLNAYVFAEYGASFNLFGIKTFSDSTQFINAQNSPVKINLHWEDGKLVEKCSYGDDITGSSSKPAKSLTYLGSYSSYGTEYSGLISSTDDEYSPYQTWTESKKLDGNVTVNGDLYLENSVDLNGYTLTVYGNLIQKGGSMNINSGTLNVNGDYIITSKTHYDEKEDKTYQDSTGKLYMQYANGYVNVLGDFHTYSEESCSSSSGYNYFNKGTLTIYGDFYQHSGDGLDDGYSSNFQPKSTFNLVFSGSGVHEVYFESASSHMTGVQEANGATIKITGVLCGITLNNDITIAGDMPLNAGSMDLNGYTLTINGSLVQDGGSMVIGGGTLNVIGDYTITSATHYDEKEDRIYQDSTGKLRMDDATGNANIKGDFHTYSEESCSSSSGYNYFNKGTLTIYGNFYQHSGDGLDDGYSSNFQPKSTFNLVFSGSGVHEVYFESTSSHMTGIKEIDGATIKISGVLYGITLNNDITVTEDMPLNSGTMNLNGHSLTINGDLVQDGGSMIIGSGTLNVNGNYTITSATHYDEKEDKTYQDSTGKLYMDDATGNISIKGDFHTYSEESCSSSSGYNYFNKGTMTIYGNFYQHSGTGLDDGYSSNFQPKSTFNLVFSGSRVHEVYFESTSSHMTGVQEANGATIKITGVICGITLNNDITISGDMPLNAGTMNLNGHTLTINGSVNQTGGSMVIGGGTLNVNGDYTITSATHYDEKEDKTYQDSTGVLRMDDATGNINIKGDFHTYSEESCSSSSGYNYFNKGTMTIYGNLYQHSGDGLGDGYSGNFKPASAFKLIFAGNTTHIFSSNSTSTTTGTISLNKGGKVTFKGNLGGLENVENCSFMSDGTIVSVNKNTISAAYPGTGQITVMNTSNNKATINVTVTDYVEGDVNCDGKVTVADVVLLQKWLLTDPSAFLPCWKTADLYEDDKLDVFDLVLLKRMLIYG